MKNIVLNLIFIGLLACNSKEEPVNYQDDPSLKNSINIFNNAFKIADVKSLDSLLANDYLHTNGTNRAFGKKKWLDYISQRRQDIVSGKLQIIDYAMDQIEIQKYEHTAVVAGRVASTYILDGEEKSSQFRVTHLWVVEDGIWKRAAFHDGKIK